MAFTIPKTDFTPHPDGLHHGRIVQVVDEGEREATYDGRTRMVHKISIDVESETAAMDDGRPFVHREWCSLSSNDRSKLLKLRQGLLKRPLTEDEKLSFDPEQEMVGKVVQYVIEHAFRNGRTFAGISSWSPMDDQAGAGMKAAAAEAVAGVDDNSPPSTTEVESGLAL